MTDITYRQPEKDAVRQKTLQYAVESLTINRSQACCVERNYVRNLYNALSFEPSAELKKELVRIDTAYLGYWERLHDSCVGSRSASDLVVCYLSGPEPQNDFRVLTSLGILPQNIWAFEYDKDMIAVFGFCRSCMQRERIRMSHCSPLSAMTLWPLRLMKYSGEV